MAGGVNKLTHVLNAIRPFAIVLCKSSQFISLRIWLAEYPQQVRRPSCMESLLECFGPFLL